MLNRFIKSPEFTDKIPKLVISISLIVIVSVHLFAFGFYLLLAEKNRMLYRVSYIHHISDEAKLLTMIDKNQLLQAAHDLEDDEVDTNRHKITVSDTPTYPLQIQDISYTAINKIIPQHVRSANFSIQQAHDGKWINYQIQLEPLHSTTTSLVIFSQMMQILIFVSLFVYVWRFNKFSPLLKNFRFAAQQLGIEVRSYPTKKRGSSQIEAVSNAMKQLQQRIMDLVQRRNQLLACISHDLKTPITRLQLQLPFIHDANRAAAIEEELTEMNAMLNQLIQFAQHDPVTEKLVKLDLVSLLQSIADRTLQDAQETTLYTELTRAVIQGRSLALKRAFTNVVNNAAKYASKVIIHLEKNEHEYIIHVDDNGPGINPAEIDKVFIPFYRCQESKLEKHGSGLGLTITKEAIQTHHGKIVLHNRAEGGLRVSIYLPLSLDENNAAIESCHHGEQLVTI